jgi:5-methylcytosine-specific restriction enzyme A
MIDHFENDDEGYLAWVRANPSGYVVNVDRARRYPQYPMVHRAKHALMSSPARTNYTTNEYIKICSLDLSELESLALNEYKRKLVRCSTCMSGSGPAGLDDSASERTVESAPRFEAGAPYTRSQIFESLGLADPGGGPWYTGYTSHGADYYIFCGVGTAGRTGHDYQNHFDGPELVWHGKTNSRLDQNSIKALLSGKGSVHIFYRTEDRAPFTYAGAGRPVSVQDVVPVQVRWAFDRDPGPHPEYLPEEVGGDAVVEGAKRTITVNVYERDPSARIRCIARWSCTCAVCGFDFARHFGELGKGFIHVHHLRPLAEIGEEYVLNPEEDLRPVCPNCHAMLHRVRPAMAIEDLQKIIKSAQVP